MTTKYLMTSKAQDGREHTVFDSVDSLKDVNGVSLSVYPTMVEIHTIDTSDMIAKRFSLVKIPINPAFIKIDVIGGPITEYGVDFNIILLNQVNWNSLGFDGQIAIGDKLRVTYDI